MTPVSGMLPDPSCADRSGQLPSPRDAPRSRALLLVAASVLALAVVALLPDRGAGQTLEGKVVEQATSAPVGGAVVRLLPGGGESVDQALSDEDGHFTLEASSGGDHRIEVERIGFETWRSGSFRLPEGETLRRTFQVPVQPVQLEGIVAEGERKCRGGLSEGRQVATLWQELRKALERERDTRREAGLRFQLREYTRQLDRGLGVEDEESRTTWTSARTPFRSVAPEDLVDRGFVLRDARGTLYRAPDADVILSDAFQSTHCFEPVRDGGRLGLRFRPVEDRDVAEVEGTLWLDEETAKLQELTFHYVSLEEPIPDGAARGMVEFEELPDGRWIVRDWWIRWPRTVQHRDFGPEVAGRGPGDENRDLVVTRYEQVGGQVTGVRREGGGEVADVEAVPRGGVAGTVYDSVQGRPLSGARVVLQGTGRSARTGPSGEFVIDGVPKGRYSVSFRHPTLGWLGDLGSARWVEIVGGFTTETRLTTPGSRELHARLCGEAPEGDTVPDPDAEGVPSTGAVAGRVVTESDGSAARQVQVRFDWRDRDSERAAGRAGILGRLGRSAVTVTDSAGTFAACGVPLDRRITVGAGGSQVQVELTDDDPLALVELEHRPREEVRVTRGATDGRETEILGRVLSAEDGRPLRGAQVKLVGPDRSVASAEGGIFRLAEVTPGSHRVVVEHLGYTSDTVEVDLREGAASFVRLSLEAAPVELPELTATVERTIRDSQLRGFYRRLDEGAGRYIIGDEVEEHGWITTFRRSPNVRVVQCPSQHGPRISGCYLLDVRRGGAGDRGYCSPDIYVDGMKLASPSPGDLSFSTQPFDLLRSYAPEQIEGVEVHTPGTAPAQYGGLGAGCGVVLVWTNR